MSWRSYSFLWKDIPLDNGQWKEGILMRILASMKLTKCHRVAVFGYPLLVGLSVIRKGHSHLLFYRRGRDRPVLASQVSASPAHATLKRHLLSWHDYSWFIGLSLDHFNLVSVLFSVGVPSSWSVLQLGTYKGPVDHFPDFWRLSFYMSPYKAQVRRLSFYMSPYKAQVPVGTCCN